MMWMARYQWHPFGRELPFSQSDVEFHEKPAATLAFGAAKNRGPFTRFSTSGGGQLDGFEPGETGHDDLRQLVEETALKYRRFSFQHEFHWKDVEDCVNQTTTNLRGSYVQAGYLPWGRSKRTLQPLELAVRYAFVDPDTSRPATYGRDDVWRQLVLRPARQQAHLRCLPAFTRAGRESSPRGFPREVTVGYQFLS